MTETAAHTSVPLDDNIMDFSITRKSLPFRVDNDVFEASPDIAAELALRFADISETLSSPDANNEQQIEVLHALFRMVLFPDSAERFIARLSDQTNPIGNDRVMKISRWLFEEYGLRPTTSDSASSTGSENQDAGTSSTVLTLAAGSSSPSSDSPTS